MAVSYVVIQAMKQGHLPILLPVPVLVGIFVLTVMMCLWSSRAVDFQGDENRSGDGV